MDFVCLVFIVWYACLAWKIKKNIREFLSFVFSECCFSRLSLESWAREKTLKWCSRGMLWWENGSHREPSHSAWWRSSVQHSSRFRLQQDNHGAAGERCQAKEITLLGFLLPFLYSSPGPGVGGAFLLLGAVSSPAPSQGEVGPTFPLCRAASLRHLLLCSALLQQSSYCGLCSHCS